MKFISLFSGFEGASLAWKPLDWECVAVAEIDAAACAVLRHHHREIPNLGSVTDITEKQVRDIGPVNAVVFGFPCQDLSIAGKRAGLKGERSGLFFDAMRIVRWSGTRWAIAENVPGLFSSNNGLDFAAVVGEMAGICVDVPDGGWANSGFLLGPDGLVEWAVLDAQHFGVPQRRRRIFIVRDSGDWGSRPPILLERESLQGNPPPSRKVGQIAPTIPCRRTGGGGLGTDFDCDGGAIAEGWWGNNTAGPIDVATAVNAHGGPSGRMDFESETFVTQTVATLDASYGKLQGCSGQDALHNHSHLVPTALKASHFTRGKSGAPSDIAPPLSADADKGDQDTLIAFTSSSICPPVTSSDGGGVGPPTVAFQASDYANGMFESCDISRPITTSADRTRSAPITGMQVRRLTPKECARLQGVPDDYLSSVRVNGKKLADGPMYKMLGNGFAIPCVRWIGERIQMVEDL